MSKPGKKSLMRDQRGLSTVEYTVLLVLIVSGAIGVWTNFGDKVKAKITDSTGRIEALPVE